MPRWLHRTLWVVAALLLAASLAYVALTSADRTFRARVAQLRAERFATTMAEFRGPAPPGAVAAAAEMEAACDDLRARAANPDPEESGSSGLWDWDTFEMWLDPEYPERTQAVGVWLESARPFYERVSGAIAAPEIRFPAGSDDYANSHMVARVGGALTARARAARDFADRLAACRDLLRLGRGLEWSLLPWVHVEERALMEPRRGVTSGEIDARLAAQALGDDLVAPPIDLGLVARAQVARNAEEWSAVLDGRANWAPTERERLGYEVQRLCGSESFYLHGCGGAHGTGRLNSGLLIIELDMMAALARAPETWPRSADPPLPDAFEQQEAETWAAIGERLRRHAAALVLARVALAVKGHEEATGDWPAALDHVADAFGGAVPRDPFGGAPFSYGVDTDGVRLASVGRDPSDSPLTDEDRLECGLVWEFPADEFR